MSTYIDINPVTQIRRQARYGTTRPALIYNDEQISYPQLAETVERWAAYLEQHGVEKEDRVLYLGLNSRSFVYTMLAAWRLGASFMPMNFRLVPAEIEGLIERGTPKVAVVEPGHQDVFENVKTDLDIARLLVDDDDAVPPAGEVGPEWDRTSTDLPEDGPSVGVVQRSMDDLAVLMFTSGTTGVPKGVRLTFGNLWWNSNNVDTMVDSRPGDVTLATAPLFHIGALNSFAIRALVRGNTVLIHRKFSPKAVMDDIARYGVGSAFLVPSQLAAMSAHESFADADFTTLRATIAAGAPVPRSLLETYLEKGVVVQQAWGLTETSPFATYLTPEMARTKAGSCGIPMPYTEVILMDPATFEEITEPGVTGEMLVRGPNVTPGYWNAPEVDAASFHEGWFRSGDIGYADEDGYLFIVDRLKDLIISGGENIYPAEIERVLAGYPGIVDVAVVGSPHEKWGEAVVAVMTMESGLTPTLEEVREYCSNHLARYKLPQELVLVNEVERSSSGKLLKGAIRDTVARHLSEQSS